jgi:hypothetical protein
MIIAQTTGTYFNPNQIITENRAVFSVTAFLSPNVEKRGLPPIVL